MTKRGFFLFLAKLLSAKHRDDFVVRLGVALLLGELGLAGKLADGLGFILRSFLGLFMEFGIFTIDATIDAYREGKKLAEFEKRATELYNETSAKIYNEEQKNAYRQQYLEVIGRIGNVGNPR